MTEQKDMTCFYAMCLGQSLSYIHVLVCAIRSLHPHGLPEWAEKLVNDAGALVQEMLKEI